MASDTVCFFCDGAMENSVSADSVAEADVFALFSEGGQACVQVFFYRGGQNWGGRAYFPRVDKSDTDPEILSAFLGQFYEDKPVARLILSNVVPFEKELLEEAFSMKAKEADGRRVVSIERPDMPPRLRRIVSASFWPPVDGVHECVSSITANVIRAPRRDRACDVTGSIRPPFGRLMRVWPVSGMSAAMSPSSIIGTSARHTLSV